MRAAAVDHVSIALADLQLGLAAFQALGFEVHTSEGRGVIDVGPSEVKLLQASPTARGRFIAIAGEPGPTQVSDDPAIPLRFVAEPGRDPRTGSHPNTVLHLERVYIAVPDVRAAAPTYARLLDLPVPSVQRGNVIKADMCVFTVGAVGIGVAQPVEPGPAATALDRDGPGLFQLLFRTRSQAAATHWMTEHGLPEPTRGTRNTGEPAMLVGPEHACGLYLAFVGPD